MKSVGIRELKSRLSEYLRGVRAGEVIVVTDRGRAVAEIRQPGSFPPGERIPGPLAELSRRGLVRLGGGPSRSRYQELGRLVADGTAADLLEAERRER